MATEAFGKGMSQMRAVRLGYDQWQHIDCTAAGRDMTAQEWRSLTEFPVPVDLRCER
jgi:hypothetical protein